MPQGVTRFPAKCIHLLACVIFAGLLCLPALDTFFRISPQVNLMETEPAPLPEVSLSKLFKIFNILQKGYLEKTFGFRKLLVRWENMLDIFGLASSTMYHPVLVGKDAWLFLSQENGDLNVVDNYRGLSLFTPEQLRAWVDIFTERKNWLSARGIQYLVVIAPNKHTVYSEYLPSQYNRIGGQDRMDQLTGALEKAGIDVLDLRETMASIKDKALAYYRTDNHWTTYGAFAAYVEIMKRLGKYFPPMANQLKGAYDIEISPGLPGGLAYMLALGDKFPEDKVTFIPKEPRKAKPVAVDYSNPMYFQPPVVMETGNPDQPRAVVFRDSFAHELIPFLSEHFSRVVYLWPYPTALKNVRLFDREVIEKEKPQLVIDEFVERYFTEFPPDAASLARKAAAPE